ncbi:MAG TPA: transposase [Hyphomonadaceae bacterium]|nr:transposase [Hyphomonadaceae bacterium]
MKSKKKHSPREIVALLRRLDALIARGCRVSDAAQDAGVTAITYYRWRKKYDRLSDEQVEWLMELQAENARLRKSVADLKLDKLILLEVSKDTLSSSRLRRACIDHIRATLGVSERRACQLLGQHRSTQRKIPKLSRTQSNGSVAPLSPTQSA